MKPPKSVEAENEELAKAVNAQWQSFIATCEALKEAAEDEGIAVEFACRTIWDLWNDEAKREVMGWTAWNDIFHPGNTELQEFFELIEDRIVLNSESNRNRFHNLLLVDSDPTLADLHLLRRRHFTPITQFNRRISRLKDLMAEPDSEKKLKKAEQIIAPAKEEQPDPDPLDKDFELKKDVGYWRGKRAIRLDESSPFAGKFRSKFIKAYFILKKGDAKIIATNDDGIAEVGTVLLPQSDEDYLDLVIWLSNRLGMQIVS